MPSQRPALTAGLPCCSSQTGEIPVTKEDALQSARIAIQSGRILAVKGLGGFHLACDAGNSNICQRTKKSQKTG